MAVLTTAELAAVPEDQKRRALSRRLEQLRRRAPFSLAAHARFIHRNSEDEPLRMARHHQEWVALAEAREKHPFLCIVAPPGYAKSTWWSVAYPAWRLGATGGKVRIGLVSNAQGLTWGFSQAIGDAIESDNFARAYPDVRPDYERGWRATEKFVTGAPEGANPSLVAVGIGGQVPGRRFDEIVLDDPTSYQDALSPTVMEKQKQFVRNTLIRRLPPGMRPPNGEGGRVIAVMTRWGPNDLYDLFKELGFHMVHMPALGYWDRVVDEEGNVEFGTAPLWPENESLEVLLADKAKDEITFELVMQGNPQALSGDMFDSETFERVDGAPDRWEFESVVMGVDTSSGKKKLKGDFSCFAIVGKQEDRIYVLDMKVGRYSTLKQEDALFEMWQAWRPDKIVIEEANEGTALAQRAAALNLSMPIAEDKSQPHTLPKDVKAIPLAAAYRGRRVVHLQGEWCMPYENQLQAFPYADHDDMVDAVRIAYMNLAGETSAGPRVRVLRRGGMPVR